MKGLYDMAQSKDENGLSKFDEQKLRRALDGNKKLFSRNAEVFAQGEPRFHTCKMYDPCPICDKCRNKASHLYVKCQNCQIPICVHTYADRSKMIRRENFKLNVVDNVKDQLKEIADKVIVEK
jgi:hypothetical protein